MPKASGGMGRGNEIVLLMKQTPIHSSGKEMWDVRNRFNEQLCALTCSDVILRHLNHFRLHVLQSK